MNGFLFWAFILLCFDLSFFLPLTLDLFKKVGVFILHGEEFLHIG
jgi:hypothetical protein